jgi:peptidoglycan/xylan/chitin deacetylase (PgdA/CDA1 family)
MRFGLKQTARLALKAVAATVDPLFGPFPGPRILIYHQIGVNFGREMEVSTETFISQLEWMKQHGEIVDIETAIKRRSEFADRMIFVLTFDDGFEDVYHNAFPVMREREIPFTLYLTTKPIETGQSLDPRYPEARPLAWDQVNEMASSGLATIGAHTHTHLDLRTASMREIRNELDRSDNAIARNIGHTPKHFTYPWGWWSRTADPLVRERYATATVGLTSPITADSDVAILGRLPVQSSDGVIWFARRLTTGLRLESVVRSQLAGYSGP